MSKNTKHKTKWNKMFIVLIFFFNNYMIVKSQIINDPCNSDYPFIGIPETTLCDQYGNLPCTIFVGEGTNIPSSHILGSSYTGNVCIVGDFKINNNFTFINCIIKIAPGVDISVLPVNIGKRTFVVDNSKLFCCTDLWEGIYLWHNTVMITKNNTIIEDAKTAIKNLTDINTSLNITNTTFNRNVIGIFLNQISSTVSSVRIDKFNSNRFTCTSPLNGTTNQISLAGIKSNNVPLAINPKIDAYNNSFKGLQNGIIAEGGNTIVSGRYFKFTNIRKDGIFINKGSLYLKSSNFKDCEEKGVNINFATIVDISTNCNFEITPNIPISSKYSEGVYIESFSLNSKINLTLNFTAILGGIDKSVRGIKLMGTNVGSGTEISIFGSNFFIKAISSDGINLAGAFPASSKIDIYGNYFATGSIITKTTRGISSDGNRNNLSIYGNEFTGNGYWNTTISCSNSVGINNYISDNHTEGTGYIETSGEYFSHGMFINNFQNATICHNTNLFGSDYAFNFWGTNLGTDFKNNIMIANPLAVEIFNKSQIDIQLHNGNKWLPYYSQSQNGFTLIWRTKAATCKDPSDAPFSKFIVHTDQSIWNDVDKKYDFFSEYFGELIEPNTDEFFKIDYNGIPVSNCSIKLASINENDKLIAEDSLISSTNAYIGWSSKLYLYKKLMENPILLDSCISCQSFIINNSISSIGHLYEIYTTIESAFKADSLSYYQSGLTLLQIDSLVKNVEFIDNQMDSTLNYFIEDSLLNLKSILLEEIQILQNSYRTINDLYYSEVLNLLNNALNLTQHFNPQSQLESNEKNVTLIYLQSLINQNGSLNSEQIDTLILISQQNSDIGGQAVANAYNLLPDCKKIGLNYYLNEIFLTPLNPIPDTLFNINPIINKNSFLKSTDYFSTLNELNSIDQNLGTLKIFDLSGRVLYEQNECLNIVPSNLQQQLPSGVYFICFQNIQGLRIKKYVIQN